MGRLCNLVVGARGGWAEPTIRPFNVAAAMPTHSILDTGLVWLWLDFVDIAVVFAALAGNLWQGPSPPSQGHRASMASSMFL